MSSISINYESREEYMQLARCLESEGIIWGGSRDSPAKNIEYNSEPNRRALLVNFSDKTVLHTQKSGTNMTVQEFMDEKSIKLLIPTPTERVFKKCVEKLEELNYNIVNSLPESIDEYVCVLANLHTKSAKIEKLLDNLSHNLGHNRVINLDSLGNYVAVSELDGIFAVPDNTIAEMLSFLGYKSLPSVESKFLEVRRSLRRFSYRTTEAILNNNLVVGRLPENVT